MQTWHCIVIIALTLGAFLYVTYLDNIENEAKFTLEQLNEIASGKISSESESISKEIDSDPSSQSHLSQKILWLDSNDPRENILDLHRSALEGDAFIKILLKELDKVPTIKKDIFNPFTSELHAIEEKTILGSLVSCIPISGKIKIICRGHSQRTSELLAELILRIYPKSLAFEQEDSPLLPELELFLSKISNLQKNANQLKITIHEKLADDPADSIVVIATKSEILQIDHEMSALKNHLKEIDSIYRNKLHPLKLVEVEPISAYGQVKELSDLLAQLKSLSNASDLNDFTRKEVKRKIQETSLNLENEVVKAIDDLKSNVGLLIDRKKELQKSAVDSIEASRLSVSRDPAVAKLEDIRKKLAVLKSDFDQQKLEWITAKKSFSLILKPD